MQGELIRAGDFFFCASERQRDYWLGWLNAQKRINPHTLHNDHSLRKLIDVVPFGISDTAPIHTKAVLKGVHPGISPGDRLIVWSGGLWDWLDPLTLVRAMALLTQKHPDYKLYFMGTHHPNAIVSGMEMPGKVIQLSKELGLYDRSIFFGRWTPYEERQNFLVEADLSVVAHVEHIETHFSFRTRALDCIWASIPMVVTEGDAMSELVGKEGLGITIPPGNEPAMAEAIEKILSEPDAGRYKTNLDRIKSRFYWDAISKPLRQFCQNPGFTADKGKYLTEAEKISRDKDAFLENVVRDKDAYIQQVIQDKDHFLAQVIENKDKYFDQAIREKDARCEQSLSDKDHFWQEIVDEKNEMLRHPLRLMTQQVTGKIKRLFRKQP